MGSTGSRIQVWISRWMGYDLQLVLVRSSISCLSVAVNIVVERII